MKKLLKHFKRKDGGVVLSLVIVMMLIFPLIISGLIDMTNCTIIKRNLKQNLNMAAKAAANTMDMTATRNGVYRIKDGVLNSEVYSFSLYGVGQSINSPDDSERYYENENDASKVFFSTLANNGFIDYDLDNPDTQYVYNYIETKNINPYTHVAEDYVRIKYSQPLNIDTRQRECQFSFIVINNGYDYVKALIDSEDPTRAEVVLEDGNIGLELDGDEQIGSIIVNTYNPTVVGVGVIEYRLSPIFKIFGFDTIYLKEYTTSELIISNNYWNN